MRYKIQNRNVSAQQFIKIAAKLGITLNLDSFSNMSHGELIMAIADHDKKIEIHYYLKKYWIQKFNMNYSANQKVKKGGELIISSLPMPNINKYLHCNVRR